MTSALPARSADAAFVENQIIVKFKPQTAKSHALTLQNAVGIDRAQALNLIQAELWTLHGATVEEALQAARSDPSVEYAEPNYLYHSDATGANDPLFSQQWALQNVLDTDVEAQDAWDTSTGSDVLIGVLDSGIDRTHPDLVDNIFVNPNEIAGNGIDDDGNGLVDDVHGWDFAYNTNDPSDALGHGTHIAGIIAARGNNGIGIAGLNWTARLLPIKCLRDSGLGSLDALLNSIEYARSMGVRVINASWGGPKSIALADAIRMVERDGILFVTSAGNDASPYGTEYPASYDIDNIISVASIDSSGALSSFSNYGSTIDLAAPGNSVLSCKPGGKYVRKSGTSMAAPHVTGAAALVWSYAPSLTASEVKALILGGVVRTGNLTGVVKSGGRLSLEFLRTLDKSVPNPVTDLGVTQVESNEVTLSWTASGDDGNVGRADVYDARGSVNPITDANFDSAEVKADVPPPAVAGSHETRVFGGLHPNTHYYFALKVQDDVGNKSSLSNLTEASTTSAPELQVAPSSMNVVLDPGEVAERTLTLRNNGAGRLNVLLLADDWIRTEPPQATVLPGDSLRIKVTIGTPELPSGNHDADIWISGNNPESASIPVGVEVRSGAHLIAPTLMDFGTQYLSANAVKTISIQNIGPEPLNVDTLLVSGAFTVATAVGFVLATHESRTIPVTFVPAALGPQQGELIIKSNFRSHPAFPIQLLGLAKHLQVANVAPSGIHVSLATGEKKSVPLMVSNQGDAPLEWSLRTLRPDNPTRAAPHAVNLGSSDITTLTATRPDGWTPLTGPSTVPPTDLSQKRLLEVCPYNRCCCVSTVFYDLQQQGLGPIEGASTIPAALDGFDIVYLLDSGATDMSNAPALKDWVRAGGVLIIDGFQRITEFNDLLSDSKIQLTSTRLDDFPTQPLPRIFPHRTTRNIDKIGFEQPLLLEASYPARVLMRDPDDHPLMAMQPIGAGMVVVIPYYTFGEFYVRQTWNDNRRFANQMFHWLFSDVRWLSTSDWKGTTDGHQVSQALVTFDADDLVAGAYTCSMELRSNDPGTPVISIPVTLDVTAAPDVFVEKSSVDFGPLFVGASAEKKIQIWNLGSADLRLSPFQFSAPEFSAQFPSYVVPPGAFGRPRVHAAPRAEGVVKGSVEIGTNDPEGPIAFDLRAEGLPTPSAAISDQPIAGELEDGQTSNHTIAIANTGRSGLQWSIDVSGGTDVNSLAGVRVLFGGEKDWERIRAAIADNGAVVDRYNSALTPELLREHDVLVLSNAPADVDAIVAWVQAGGSLLLDVENDLQVDAANALLTHFGNHAVYDRVPYFTNWARVANADSLTSAGVDSLFVAPNGQPVGAISPFVSLARQIDPNTQFYPVAVRGEWGRGHVVALGGRLASDEALSKPGADNLRFITNLVAWLSPQPRWMRMFPRSGTVDPGATQQVDVTFTPVGHSGQHQTVVTVNTNDPLHPKSSRPVTMTATPSPVIRVEPAALSFGDVARGTSASKTLVLMNEGSDALQVSKLDVSGSGFSVNLPPGTLPPGARHELAVTYKPAGTGDATGELQLQTNASNAPVVRVPMSGRGVKAPSMEIESAPLAFEALIGQSFADSVVIRNTGEGDLKFDTRASLAGGERPLGDVRLLFDSRDNSLRASDFSVLMSDLATSGVAITVNHHETLTPERLASYDVLWLLGDAYNWSGPEEMSAVRDWIVTGGSLLTANDHSAGIYYFLADSLEAHIQFWENGNRATRGITSNISPHEITDGVANVMLSRNFASLVVTDPAMVLVRDTGGEPCAACEQIGFGRIVVCAEQLFHDDHTAHADTRRFDNQAFAWLAHNARPLSAQPASGTIAPGHAMMVKLTSRSMGLVPGPYTGGIEILHNVPGQGRLFLPVSMSVAASPALAIPSALDIGGVERGKTAVAPLFVINRGSSTLQVSDIHVDGTAFTLQGRRAFSLEPGHYQRVPVTCRPVTRGDLPGTVTIDSNIPYSNATSVRIDASGLEPATLHPSPDTLRVDVTEGEQSTSSFSLQNLGDIEAAWNANKGWQRMVQWDTEQPRLPGLDGITITYEEGNGQEWVADLWSDTWRTLERRGAITTGRERNSDKIDQGNILWLTDGNEPYDASELEALVKWVRAGGALLLEGDNPGMLPEYNRILTALDAGVEFLPIQSAGGPIRDFALHETTQGVHELQSLAGTARLSQPRGRAQLIAKDAGGSPCVVLSTAGRGRIAVMSNEFFCDESLAGRNDNELFAQRMFGWLAYGTPWLTVASEAGMVPPAKTVDNPLEIHGDAVEPGDYVLPLHVVATNGSSATMPIQLHVAHRPNLALSQSQLRFEATEVGKTREQSVSVTNTGAEAQALTFASSTPNVFAVKPSSARLEAGAEMSLIATFAPIDSGIAQGSIRIKSDKTDGWIEFLLHGTGMRRNERSLPARFALHQNAPNPFNPTTVIPYDLPSPAHVTLKLYSVDGRLVRTLQDGSQNAGFYRPQWDGTDNRGEHVSSGVYFCRLTAGAFVATNKMVLLK
jgi:subtilisin family serine protease